MKGRVTSPPGWPTTIASTGARRGATCGWPGAWTPAGTGWPGPCARATVNRAQVEVIVARPGGPARRPRPRPRCPGRGAAGRARRRGSGRGSCGSWAAGSSTSWPPRWPKTHERRALEREEAHAAAVSSLTGRRRGDGTTDLRIRVPDPVADRLLTYLEAFTSPRHVPRRSTALRPEARPRLRRLPGIGRSRPDAAARRRRHHGDRHHRSPDPRRRTRRSGSGPARGRADQRRPGPPARLHGQHPARGPRQATPRPSTSAALVGCSVPAQRKAMAVRDVTCRAEGCEIPAAWCEAHHADTPWASGGRTDLADGALLCSWHHHRAHDHRYRTRRLPTGDFTFHRRT